MLREVAPVVDHASVEPCPGKILGGVAVKELMTGGAGGGGGTAVTVTVAEQFAVPPAPVTVARYRVVIVGETDFVPLTPMAPTPLLTVADDAFVDERVKVEALPFTTELGLAESEQVGAGVRRFRPPKRFVTIVVTDVVTLDELEELDELDEPDELEELPEVP